MSADIFAAIEDVLRDRNRTGGNYTVYEMVYDIFKIADEKEPGAMLAARDVRRVMMKAGRNAGISVVSRQVGQLKDEGRIEFVGKEKRSGITTHSVPVYRLARETVVN
jgi:hypothetical protein